MDSNRVNQIDEIGLSVLELAIQRKLGWIIREVRKKDVGIDANIEQVVELGRVHRCYNALSINVSTVP